MYAGIGPTFHPTPERATIQHVAGIALGQTTRMAVSDVQFCEKTELAPEPSWAPRGARWRGRRNGGLTAVRIAHHDIHRRVELRREPPAVRGGARRAAISLRDRGNDVLRGDAVRDDVIREDRAKCAIVLGLSRWFTMPPGSAARAP